MRLLLELSLNSTVNNCNNLIKNPKVLKKSADIHGKKSQKINKGIPLLVQLHCTKPSL